jgi:hypothetical protein
MTPCLHLPPFPRDSLKQVLDFTDSSVNVSIPLSIKAFQKRVVLPLCKYIHPVCK